MKNRQDKSGNGEFYNTLCAKLKIIPGLQDRASWLLENINKTTDEALLAFYKDIRGTNELPPEASFFLIAWIILNKIAAKRIMEGEDTKLKDVNDRLEAVRKKYGLQDNEFWPIGEAPEDYQALQDEWNRILHQIEADAFCECGEREMAELYLTDRGEFDRLYEAGRRYFHP